jgi:hypothetical protein
LIIKGIITNDINQALIEACKPGSSETDKELAQSCIGILFFGVPNQGLNSDSLISLVKGQGNKQLLQELSNPSKYVLNLVNEFSRCYDHVMRKRCIIVSFYESKDTPAFVIRLSSQLPTSYQ